MKKFRLLILTALLSLSAFATTEVNMVTKFNKDLKDFIKYQNSKDQDKISMCYMFMAMNESYNKLSEDQKVIALKGSNKKKVDKSFNIGNRQCKYWVQTSLY